MIGPLPYIGGKYRLAKKIIALFPEHTAYVEPFAGGAQVFFHKQPSRVEVLNDLSGDIVTFFRVCQHHYEELARYLKFTVASRRIFQLFQETPPDTLTDVQRAARFFYLQKNAFGALVVKQNFHYAVVDRPNFRPERIPEILENTHRRLQGVQIESLPYEEVIERYDRKATLFYLDPPYWDRQLYKFNFTDEDFAKLKERLERIEGKFILSLNDLPKARKLFHKFKVRAVSIAYTAQKHAERRYPELIIRNF
jgi:DNA adenine methylase